MTDANREVAWRLREITPDPRVSGLLSMEHELALETDIGQTTSALTPVIDAEVVGDMLARSELKPNTDTPFPSEGLGRTSSRVKRLEVCTYPEFAEDRFTIVGAGAASLVMASYLTMRSVPPRHITIADPRGEFGGTWRDASKLSGGFNNPYPLTLSPGQRLRLQDRKGEKMEGFLEGIADDWLDEVNFVASSIVRAKRDQQGKWVTRTRDYRRQRADYLILAMGISKPRPIHGTRLQSNLDIVSGDVASSEIVVERYQRELSDEELASGRPIVLLGLGNSAAAMVHMIQNYEDQHGVTVPHVVVTDHTRRAIENPREIVDGRKSIFRKPEGGYFTGYSGDLERDETGYYRLLREGRIVSDTRGVYFDRARGSLVLETDQGKSIIDRPHVFALLGSTRDDKLFRKVGALGKHGGRKDPKIRASDGAVSTWQDGYLSNVFAIGSVAATPANASISVIPGILAQTPATVMTMGVRSIVRQAPKR